MPYVRALEAPMLLLLEPVLNPVWSWLMHAGMPKAWWLVGGAIILSGTLAKSDGFAAGAGRLETTT